MPQGIQFKVVKGGVSLRLERVRCDSDAAQAEANIHHSELVALEVVLS